MRKAAGLALLVMLAVVSGNLAPAPARAQATFRLTGTQTDIKPSTEVGDVFLLRETLFDDAGTRVGVSNIACTETFHQTLVCTAALTLRGRGEIVLGGTIPFDPVFTIAITGGTGEFRTAAGEVRVDVSAPDRQTTVYTVRLV
ncbi:MAG: hypothetical protein LC722_08010 [Actinobacteria bacterium]|nr:hypothetical protein [Actinomycetota bacterium]